VKEELVGASLILKLVREDCLRLAQRLLRGDEPTPEIEAKVGELAGVLSKLSIDLRKCAKAKR